MWLISSVLNMWGLGREIERQRPRQRRRGERRGKGTGERRKEGVGEESKERRRKGEGRTLADQEVNHYNNDCIHG